MRVVYTPTTTRSGCSEPSEQVARKSGVRLAYIDAPEIGGHPPSRPAPSMPGAYLRRLLNLGERVEVRILGQDGYGRLIAEVISLRTYANCGLRWWLAVTSLLYQCPHQCPPRPADVPIRRPAGNSVSPWPVRFRRGVPGSAPPREGMAAGPIEWGGARPPPSPPGPSRARRGAAPPPPPSRGLSGTAAPRDRRPPPRVPRRRRGAARAALADGRTRRARAPGPGRGGGSGYRSVVSPRPNKARAVRW